MARPKSEFLSAMGVAWQIFQAIVNEVLSLGGNDEDLRRILKNSKLRKEIASLIVRAKVSVENFLEVVSNGLSGEQWITRLENARYNVGDYAKRLLRSDKFVSTNGKTYKLVVIKGDEFEDNDRITSKIREEAKKRGYLTPPVEVAPLLREAISDEELEQMGLYWLIVMHEPITVSDGYPIVLGVCRDVEGRWLGAYFGLADDRWYRVHGFVFLVPQD